MNNREIKFRVWNKETKSMHCGNVDSLQWILCGRYPIKCNVIIHEEKEIQFVNGYNADRGYESEQHFIVQQFTGFTDIEEKEIYEGDYLDFISINNSVMRGVVIFTHGSFMVQHQGGEKLSDYLVNHINARTCGNIYQGYQLEQS